MKKPFSFHTLTAADYGETAALTSNKDRYTEKMTSFTRNGGIKGLQRYGKQASGTYGYVDNLTISYSGNRISGVSDGAPVVTQNGSMDFPGGSTSSIFSYNAFGALTADPSRGITSITYDNLGNPTKIQFSNGRSITNVYSSTGEKLKTSNQVSVLAPADAASPFDMEMDLESASSEDAIDTQAVVAQNTISYHGPIIYRNNAIDKVLFQGGYATISGTTVTFHYYTQDYLGNNRAVINGSTGAIEQTIAYYPFGAVIADLGTPTTGQPYKFGGKELLTTNGLNEYDFGARNYYPAVPGFTKPDPLCEDTQHLSPYLYCGNNPVNAFDPDGRSTWVVDSGDGTYKVVGGDLKDKDLNIYVLQLTLDGKALVKSQSIGTTTSITSFFDSDYNDGEGKWMTGSVIDPNDGSGEQFMYNLISDDPSLLDYANKAQNGNEYDFKVTNGTPQENKALLSYRGMPFGYTESGEPVYTSARDIGNIAAGYVSARHKLPWWAARACFDAYQVKQSKKLKREGLSTRNAERYGYNGYKNGLPIFNKPCRSFRLFE